MEAAKSLEEGGSCHLCAICCDAPRDCFFLPCGHSATCYACGERLDKAIIFNKESSRITLLIVVMNAIY